jgi:hypothetical protein
MRTIAIYKNDIYPVAPVDEIRQLGFVFPYIIRQRRWHGRRFEVVQAEHFARRPIHLHLFRRRHLENDTVPNSGSPE